MTNAIANWCLNDEADFNLTIPLSATEFFTGSKNGGIIGGIERYTLENPVPTPVLAGSGSTGLLFEHLRQRHPAGLTYCIRPTSTVVLNNRRLSELEDTDSSEIATRFVSSVEQSLVKVN